MSNFPLAYKLSWLPRLLRPSVAGGDEDFLPPEGALLSSLPVRTKRLVFLGDISAVANRKAPEIDERLKNLIGSADLVIGNCESPVVEKPRRPLGTTAGTRHAMTASFLSQTLDAANIPLPRLVLSLANNHVLDQGPEGYAETRGTLAKLGIATIGGAEDGLVRSIDLDGLAIAFSAFTQWRNANSDEVGSRATMLGDFERQGFAALRAARADLKCIVPHWDREFRHFPQAETRRLAQRLVEGGAGLIVGHHAHVVQPAERLDSTLVAYCLGDFLGTALPRVPWPARLGAILIVEISADPPRKGRVTAYRFVPFLREKAGKHEQLVPLDALPDGMARRAQERFAAIFPPARR